MKKLILLICSIFIVNLYGLSIYDIQYTTDPSGDSPYEGDTVTVTGIVTATGYFSSGNTRFFISDPEGGAWRGIYVYEYDTGINVGDEVEVTGTVVEYYGLTELSYCDVTVLSSGNLVPPAVEISTADVSSEMYESVLVTVSDVEATSNPSSYGEWRVNDGSGECQIDDGIYEYPGVSVGDEFIKITGVVDYNFSSFDINPRSANDFIAVGDPYIAEISWGPIPLNTEDPISVTAEIYDYDGTIQSAELFYRLGSTDEYSSISMNAQGDDTFVAELAALPSEDDYYLIYVKATDDVGNSSESYPEVVEIEVPAPIIENLSLNLAAESQDLLAVATITDLDGSIEMAKIYYNLDYSSEYTEIVMEQDADDATIFRATIPAQKPGVTVNVGVYALDNDGLETSIPNLAAYTYAVESHEAILKVPARPFDPVVGATIPIDYYSKKDDKAILRIFNAEGKLVYTPKHEMITAEDGISTYDWDGRDKNGNICPIGLYFVHLQVVEATGGKSKTNTVPVVIGTPLN
ncbi:MAG: hypothetical protein R6U84_03780 [Candidatus Cloacimonadales bacterium]